MGYYNQPLGDVPRRGGFKVGGGAVRAPMGPPRSRPGQSLGAGGSGGQNVNIAAGQVPRRSGAVVGGIPTMAAIRRTMEAQGLEAEGSITRKPSKFVPEMLEPTRGQMVRGYADRLVAEAAQRGGEMSIGKALRQSKREFAAVDRGLPIPSPFNPPQMTMEPLVLAQPSEELQLTEAAPAPSPVGIPFRPFVHGLGARARFSGYDDGFGESTRAISNSPMIYQIGDEGLEGFSLKGIVKGVAKTVKKVASPVQKAAAAVGHTAGKVVTSKVGQAVLGTALAATGVGIVPAALIMGGTKAAGNLIKPGGNIKHALTGFGQGALTGAAAGVVGTAFKAVAPNAQAATSNVVKSIESKFVQGGKLAIKGTGKVLKGAENVVETVAKGAVKGTGKVLGAVAHGAVGLGKKIIGIPGSFMPTSRDPNGDGINEDNGIPSDEASAAERAGRARRGSQIPKEEKPRVGSRGQFPRTPRDPYGTGIDEITGALTAEAAGAIARGAATTPDQLPADAPPPPNYTLPYQGGGGYGGGGGGGGSFASDAASLAAGAGAAAGLEAGAVGPDTMGMAGAGGLGGLLGNINPTMLLVGGAAFFILPKLLGGGGSRSASRSRPRRSRSRSRRR